MAQILKAVGAMTNTPTSYFEVDTVEDMLAIDVTYVVMGSRCYVINDGDTYALNSAKEWKVVPGMDFPDIIYYDGGVITEESEEETVIYDGGIVK